MTRISTATTALTTMLLALAMAPAAGAADSDATARMREMLHRAQEALRQAQSDNADLVRAKSDAEQKLDAANKQLEAARGVSKAEITLRGQVKTAQAAQDDVTRKLNETAERLAAANAKLGETARQLTAREAELAQLRQGLEQGKAANASCERKNLQLYSYSQEILDAYRKKGVWGALAQKDPVLGLKNVEIENVVQEYKLKLASEQIKPQQANPQQGKP
jgi:chromosome segregation ATPase